MYNLTDARKLLEASPFNLYTETSSDRNKPAVGSKKFWLIIHSKNQFRRFGLYSNNRISEFNLQLIGETFDLPADWYKELNPVADEKD